MADEVADRSHGLAEDHTLTLLRSSRKSRRPLAQGGPDRLACGDRWPLSAVRRRRPVQLPPAAAGRLSSAEYGPAASEGAAMMHQRTASRLDFIARPEALRVAGAMAAVRLGIGATGVLAPAGSPGGCSCRAGQPMRLPRWRCALRAPVTSRWAWARRSRPGADRGRCAAGCSPAHSSIAATRPPSPGANRQALPYVL